MALDNKIKLLTMYNVWSWSSRLATACLNRRTKSLKVSQCTGQVCSVSEEELCNWMRISSRRSRDVKYSTQFTNTWGSWRKEEKWYNCIWLFQCKYSRNSFLFHMRERKKPYPANRIHSKTKKKLVKKKRINYVPSQNIMYHKLKRADECSNGTEYLLIMFKNWNTMYPLTLLKICEQYIKRKPNSI